MWNPTNFEEREIPPMSAEMFCALVTARLRPLEEIEVSGGKGLQLRVRVRGQETHAHLGRYYERYRAQPETLSPVIEQFIDTLLRGGEEIVGAAEFASVREKLVPRLMTAAQWMAKRDEGFRLVVRPVAQELGAALILDNGAAFEYVRLDAIPAWGIDTATAYEVALENLERGVSENQTRLNGAGIETLLVDHSTNASARALLSSRLADWQSRIVGKLVLGLPIHDLMLGFSVHHPAFQDLRAQVAKDARTRPNGLLSDLLLMRDATLEILVSDADFTAEHEQKFVLSE